MANRPTQVSSDALVWKGQRITLTQPCLLGRGKDNDIVLDDKEVSRRHAMICRQGNDWWLSDLGSRNGMSVNGIRLAHARRLRAGDDLSIGTQTLRFISAEDEDSRSGILFGETTQIASPKSRHSFSSAMVCELIVTAANGEILEGEKAARWFFGSTLERPSEKARPFLPTEICAWLARQRPESSTHEGAELELMEMDRRIIVTLGRFKAERYFLLVREESTQASLGRLQALGLSPREAEVMHWVCEGKTNPEIAAILDITVHTINRHLEHILAKLGVENRQKAIVLALEKLRT